MANFPAPPGHRMAYDRDGSVVAFISGGVATQQSTTVAQNLNDESGANYPSIAGSPFQIVVIFPQLRDLVAFFFAMFKDNAFGSFSPGAFDTSPDTTTGLDGTWTTRSNPFAYTDSSAIHNADRTAIQSISVPGIKAVRFAVTQNSDGIAHVIGLHLYGDITAGSEGDSLQLWNPTTDVRLSGSAMDFGDVPRSNVSQKQFRIKNRSATKTANSVVVGIEALTDTTPSVTGQHQFSLDGSTWASTVTVTSIAPGAISPVIYVRRSTDAAAALGLWDARITAVAGSWT